MPAQTKELDLVDLTTSLFRVAGSLILIPITVLLMATASWSAEPNYARPGWYLGVGVGTGIPFLEDAIQGALGEAIGLNAGASVNARGGYRVTSWFAIEALYEGVYGSDIEILGMTTAAERTTHSFVANLKFIVPIWRVHPYLAIGPGAQYGIFNDHLPFDPVDLDLRRWDFMLRVALGIDAYITQNWLVNLELAPSMRFADYKNIPSKTTDNVLLTIGAGVQYRF